jgi:hypothetical protein
MAASAPRARWSPGVGSKTPRDGQRAESGPPGCEGRARGSSPAPGAALARNMAGLTAISVALASKAVLDKAPGSARSVRLAGIREERRALRLAARWLGAIFLEIDFVIITLLRDEDVFHHLEARRTVKAAG